MDLLLSLIVVGAAGFYIIALSNGLKSEECITRSIDDLLKIILSLFIVFVVTVYNVQGHATYKEKYNKLVAEQAQAIHQD